MEQVEALFQQAEELETACEFDQVIETARKILEIDPNNVRALLLGASCYVSKEGDEHDDQQAVEWYMKAIEIEPNTGYDKFFALAQIVDGEKAIQYYEQGIKILDGEITRTNDKEAKETMKIDRTEGLRSLVEVLISDLEGPVYLNKAKDIVYKVLKENKSESSAYDVFLLAQIYDKCGKKFKPEVKVLCDAIVRRVLSEELDSQFHEKSGIFLSRFSSFCLDYGFLRQAKLVIDRLGLVGGQSADYLSLKSLCYRLLADKMLKKCHFYADTCLELFEEMENEDEPVASEDTKQTVEEIKHKTPEKLEPLFLAEKNGCSSTQNGETEDENRDETDSEEDSDDEGDFPLVNKSVTAKKYQKLYDAEVKKILELCRKDFVSSDVQDMDMDL